MVTTTPQPRINLEFLFDSNGNNNHGFRFRFSQLQVHGWRQQQLLFAAGADNEGGVEMQYPLQGRGLPEERELRGRTASNTNLTMLNNFNGRNLSGIK